MRIKQICFWKKLIEQRLIQAKSQHEQLIDDLNTQREVLKHEKSLVETAKDNLSRYQSIEERFTSKQGLNQRLDAVNQQEKVYKLTQNRINAIEQAIIQAEAQIEHTQAELINNDEDISNSTIYAQEAATVSDVHIKTGDYIQQGMALMMLLKPNHLYIKSFYPVAYFADVQHSEHITATLEDHQESLLNLVRIDQIIDPNAAHVDADFHFAQDEHPTYAVGQVIGLYLHLALDTETMAVPETSIYQDQSVYQIVNQKLVEHRITKHGVIYTLMVPCT